MDLNVRKRLLNLPTYLYDSNPYTWIEGLHIAIVTGAIQYKDSLHIETETLNIKMSYDTHVSL